MGVVHQLHLAGGGGLRITRDRVGRSGKAGRDVRFS
jgi:hypothetical protein